MDKVIKLKTDSLRDIYVSLEGSESLIISKNNRIVKADDLFRFLNYSRGDKYTVECENEKGLDAPVLKFFEELINDIVSKLNRIPNLNDDDFHR